MRPMNLRVQKGVSACADAPRPDMPFILWAGDDVAVGDGPFHRSHFGQATKNGALSLAKETGRRSLGCIRTNWAKSSNANLGPLV